MAEGKAIFGCGEPGTVRRSAMRNAGHQAPPVTEAQVLGFCLLTSRETQATENLLLLLLKLKTVMCIRKDSTEKLASAQSDQVRVMDEVLEFVWLAGSWPGQSFSFLVSPLQVRA